MSHSVFPGLMVLGMALNEPRLRETDPGPSQPPALTLSLITTWGVGSLRAGRREIKTCNTCLVLSCEGI